MARARAKTSPDAVFLNIPYDASFKPLYIAYIVGLVHLEFEPRAALLVPGGTRRLDKISREIQSCRYSVHDMSRVELDRTKPATPRFNMPFELGLAVAWEQLDADRHTWFVFEAVPYRIQKSLSDLNGTDPYIHNKTVGGVLRGLCNAFVRRSAQPDAEEMMRTYRIISRNVPEILTRTGAVDLFEARAFQSIIYATKAVIRT